MLKECILFVMLNLCWLEAILGCEGVTTFTFLQRPALSCPNLGFFQVGVLAPDYTIIGFNVCFQVEHMDLCLYLLHELLVILCH